MSVFKKLVLIFFVLSVKSYIFADTKGGILTGERYFDRIGSAWQTTLYQDLELDSLGKIISRVDYAYNSSGVLTSTSTYNCTYYATYYTLTRTYIYSGWNYWSITDWKYTYDLDGKLTSYNYSCEWTGDHDNGLTVQTDTYTYDQEKLAEFHTEYDGNGLGYIIRTLYTYDSNGRISQELTQTSDEHNWTNKERTLWTYDGNAGVGIKEIYKNTVWINNGKTIRTLNEQLKPVTEYSSYWSWGNWIDQYQYIMQYVNEGVINRHYTNIYNPATKGYDLYKLHNYYYDNYGGMSAPGNLTVTVTGDSLKLNWFAVTGSSGYKVYSSDDPYDTFIEDTTGTFNGVEWTTPASAIRRFYRVTAVDSDK
ncbi:MAG TPA: hypothetical protein PLK90_06030 [Clostridiales bacterium]|nr:hypothetical protein [Clostridiales bacterium]HQP69940.1 hypothetical protein [Clostridiales bacterium]